MGYSDVVIFGIGAGYNNGIVYLFITSGTATFLPEVSYTTGPIDVDYGSNIRYIDPQSQCVNSDYGKAIGLDNSMKYILFMTDVTEIRLVF